jgi:hypothetical protein
MHPPTEIMQRPVRINVSWFGYISDYMGKEKQRGRSKIGKEKSKNEK